MIRHITTILSEALETIECETGKRYDLTIDLDLDSWLEAYYECGHTSMFLSISSSEFQIGLASGTLTVRKKS